MTVSVPGRPATNDRCADPRNRLAVVITVVGVIVVLYFTLFPFDFVNQGRTPSEVVERFSLSPGTPWALREIPANIVLTIPLGFGVGGLVRLRTSSARKVVLAALLSALVISLSVELAQSAWLLREPSVDDVIANTAGGAVGAWLWIRTERARCELRRRVEGVASRRAREVFWFVVALLPLVIMSAITVAGRTDTELVGWDRSFPVVLGNELTGDRPWRGSISQFSLADRALTRHEIAGLLDGARMSQIAPRSSLIDEDLRDEATVPTGWRLQGSGNSSDAQFSPDGLALGPHRWIQTDQPADRISRRIAAANSFTLLVDATSASPKQSGPARLVSISSDPHHSNLTIGQEGADLVVRVRSAFTGNNGISPEFVVPDVFQRDGTRRLVVSYRPSNVSVTVDHVRDTRSIDLLPETVPLITTFADKVSILRFSAIGNASRQLFFATILFAPCALWVAMTAPHSRRRTGPLFALAIVPVFVIEALWAWTLPGDRFRAGVVLTNASAVLFLVLALGRSARRT
jgi:glycopeptide antibiotics resistance protein